MTGEYHYASGANASLTPVTDQIRALVDARLRRDAEVLERLPQQYQTHIRVWWRQGTPVAVTLEYVEAMPHESRR